MFHSRFELVFAIALAFVTKVLSESSTSHQVLQLNLKDESDVEIFKSLRNVPGCYFENLKNRKAGDKVEVAVEPYALETVMSKLNGIKSQYTYKIQGRSISKTRKPLPNELLPMDWHRFHSVPTIHYFLREVANKYPSFTKLINIGASTEGRPLLLIKIGNPPLVPQRKRSYFIDAGIHAREWAAPSTATWIINELTSNSSKYQTLLNSMDFYIIPTLNPDGYAYTQSSERFWRKTRFDTGNKKCMGIDGNRNYGYMFGGEGTSDDPCEETYRGDKPFQAPEAKAVKDFVTSMNSSVEWRIYTALHSYGQVILTPYGFAKGKTPPDHEEMMRVANKAAAAVKAAHGMIYQVGPAGEVFEPGAGGSDDWAKGSGFFKYSYTFEVRPSNLGGIGGFDLPEGEIIPVAEEVWAGIRTMAEEAVKTTG